VWELGKSGSHGTERGTLPVLAGGVVVATLRAANWKEAATAQVGERSWVFRRAGSRELVGRWAVDPEDAVRLRAQQVSAWKDTWAVDLDGTAVQVATASRWKGTHRFLVAGRVVAESGTSGWAQRPTLSTQPGLALGHAVFLLWFGLVLGRRAAAVAAAV
jgi:hypothetical protein